LSKILVKVLFYTPDGCVNMDKEVKIENLELSKFLLTLADQVTHIEILNENTAGFWIFICRWNDGKSFEMLL